MEFEYANARDLLKFIVDMCDTNAKIDWKGDDPTYEFQFISDTINKYLNQ